MTVQVELIEMQREEKPNELGRVELVALPSPGDLIAVSGGSGEMEFQPVLHVEHFPVELPRRGLSKDTRPGAVVYVAQTATP